MPPVATADISFKKQWFCCCQLLSLFYGLFVYSPCFCMVMCVSLILQSSRWGRLVLPFDVKWLLPSVFLSLPHCAAGWSAVGDCGISWSNSLFAEEKPSTEVKKINHSIEILTGDPLKYKMGDSIFIVLICLEKSIKMKKS